MDTDWPALLPTRLVSSTAFGPSLVRNQSKPGSEKWQSRRRRESTTWFDISNRRSQTVRVSRAARPGSRTRQGARAVSRGTTIPEEHLARLTFYQIAHHRRSGVVRGKGTKQTESTAYLAGNELSRFVSVSWRESRPGACCCNHPSHSPRPAILSPAARTMGGVNSEQNRPRTSSTELQDKK